ncbi:hypothetical protein K435DRAFT_868743 [Dendrothele bispora CBS 962.96]|uniref:Uncharacterized protein n=1 Tax=Dendrothele bispora (strain CBS 962.96) TaxID=1314807 RepID=A0A4S8LB07_DENBC|nr:hypothetical protein K435DRAFT_868743 [Dendrothele bispora CBS 962.96]
MSTPAKPSQPGPPVLPPYSYSYYPYPSPYNYSFDPQTGQYYVSNNQNQPQQASIQQVQFQDMTNQVTQAAESSSSSGSRKRKRTGTQGHGRGNKAQNTGTSRASVQQTQHPDESPSDVEPDADQASTPLVQNLSGVGPQASSSTPPAPMAFQPNTHFGSLVRHPKETHANTATDVWYFIRGLKSDTRPDCLSPASDDEPFLRF